MSEIANLWAESRDVVQRLANLVEYFHGSLDEAPPYLGATVEWLLMVAMPLRAALGLPSLAEEDLAPELEAIRQAAIGRLFGSLDES